MNAIHASPADTGATLTVSIAALSAAIVSALMAYFPEESERVFLGFEAEYIAADVIRRVRETASGLSRAGSR